MNADLNDRTTLLDLQGDLCSVYRGERAYVMTFVHVVDTTGHSLRLVNRVDKSRKPDWPMTEALLHAVHPAEPNKEGIRWTLRVKG